MPSCQRPVEKGYIDAQADGHEGEQDEPGQVERQEPDRAARIMVEPGAPAGRRLPARVLGTGSGSRAGSRAGGGCRHSLRCPPVTTKSSTTEDGGQVTRRNAGA